MRWKACSPRFGQDPGSVQQLFNLRQIEAAGASGKIERGGSERLQFTVAEMLPVGVEDQNCLNAHSLIVAELGHRAGDRIFRR